MAEVANMNTHQPGKGFSRTENAKVLVVDDNVDLLKLISIRLKPMKFVIKTVTSAEEALSTLSLWCADLVITDLQMSGMSGMELFATLQKRNPLLPVIILTAHGTIPEAVKATQSGVASYLTKPFDSEALTRQIQVALLTSGFSSNISNNKNTAQKIVYDHEQWRSHIVSQSPLMEALLHQMQTLAESDVLIAFEGEPGTNKDELARAVHARSQRADKPLIHLACTSVPPELLVTEVFGRQGDGDGDGDGDGASDNTSHKGLLAQAHGGTLLLSDFNEAPVPFLQKLLQALIAKKARPVDSDTSYPVNVRGLITTVDMGIYAENHQEIWNLTTQLGLTTLSVPPLRDRREDIPLIIKHSLNEIDKASEVQFSNGAMQQLLAADWPGNVRHLVNVVKQCVKLTKTKIISQALVESRIVSPAYQIQPLSNAHREFERNYLTELLKVTNGNVTKAANIAKRNRTEFHRLLKKHKIESKLFRQ